MDTKEIQNLELLLDAADFEKFLGRKILSIMSFTKPWNANMIGFGTVMMKVSSPYVFKLYYNLNCPYIFKLYVTNLIVLKINQ